MDSRDSLKKRYLYKLLTNFLSFPIGIISQSITVRALGPAAFGNFSFLTDFFSRLIGFFETGTSIAFYVKLSQRQKEPELLTFYWQFVAVISGLTALLVLGVFVTYHQDFLWPQQEGKYVWMALLLALSLWFSEITLKVVDAYGLTRHGEIARLLQKVLSFFLLLLMFYFQRFSLHEYFVYSYVSTLILMGFWWWILRANGVKLLPAVYLPVQLIKKYASEFYHYSAPLIAFAFIGLIAGVLDRWLLQKYSGSIEQGFYGLSFQIGAVCFLFTGAMTPLITREFSIAHKENDLEKMRYYFNRFTPMLYSIAAFLSIFIMFQADNVAVIMGGEGFKGSELAIAIMAFYPIHQTYGQLSGSVFYATGQTKLYRNIGIVTTILSLPVAFFLLAPTASYGLNLGSSGLALKMVAIQFVAVNVQLWYNCKFLEMSFLKFLFHQLYSVALLFLCAYGASYLSGLLAGTPLETFILAGVVYSIAAAIVLLLFPSIISLSRAELIRVIQMKGFAK